MATEKEKKDYIKRKVAEELRRERESIRSIGEKAWHEVQKIIDKIARSLRIAQDLVLEALRELGANI